MTKLEEFILSWELVSGREDHNGEPDPEQRYRIYRLCPGESEPELMWTCASEEAVGVAICTGGREGEFDPSNGDCSIGILDTFAPPGERWILRPWLANAANLSAAGKMLGTARGRKK
jgi:hypothetical protein